MKYFYLISSLPSIILGEKPFYSIQGYMETCKSLMSDSDYRELASISLDPSATSGNSNFTKKWKSYETEIRNLTSKIRATKLGKEVSTYLRPDSISSTEIDKGVSDAFAANSPLDREIILDKLRWSIIESLEADCIFDLKKLLAYKLKLSICEKSLKRNANQGQSNLDSALNTLHKKE